MNRSVSHPRAFATSRAASGWRGASIAPLRSAHRCGNRLRSRCELSIRAMANPERTKRTGLLSYLSESFMRIFSVPEDENISWEKTYLPFDGKLESHDRTRLRRLYEVVQAVKGCTDPQAANYSPDATLDDGSCEYVPGEGPSPPLENYLKGAIERVVGHQFTGEDTEPEYGITPFSGQILSPRETERLLTFAKVVKKTIDETDDSGEKKEE